MTQFSAMLLEASTAPNSADGTLRDMYVCVSQCGVCVFQSSFIYSRWFSLTLKSDETVVTVKALPALIYNTYLQKLYMHT